MAQTFHCPACQASLDYHNTQDMTIKCPYCGTTVIVPDALRSRSMTADSQIDPFSDDTLGGLKEIADLARGGKKLEAIKRYRDYFGGSLKEAKDTVDQIAAGGVVHFGATTRSTTTGSTTTGSTTTGSTTTGSTTMSADMSKLLLDITNLARSGNKIEAIKRYREAFGGDLRSAKNAVDQLAAGGRLPHGGATVRKTIESSTGNRRGCIFLILLLSVVIGAGAFLFITASDNLVDELPGQIAEIAEEVAPFVEPTPNPFADGLRAIAINSALSGPEKRAAFDAFDLTDEQIEQGLRDSGLTDTQIADTMEIITSPAPAEIGLQFGNEGINPGQFNDTRHIAVDGNGYIYTGDYSDGRVQVFDASGSFVTTWNADLDIISQLTVDRQGTVYIVRTGRIFRFDGLTGEQTLPPLESPSRMSIDTIALTADGGHVAYGVDTLSRHNAQGDLVWQTDNAITAVDDDVPLVSPVLAVDGLDNVYIGTRGGIFKFNREGQYVDRFSSNGDDVGQVDLPRAMVVDGQSRLFVSDSRAIKIFSTDGRYLDMIEYRGVIFDIALTDQGDIVAMNRNNNEVVKYIVTMP